MRDRSRSSLSLSDRLVSAFVSLVAAFATSAFLGIAILVRGGPWDAEFWSRTGVAAAGLLAVATILGFAVGPERMASAYGVIWGTEEPNVWQAFFLVLLILGVLAVLFWW